jgi:dihydrofolate reductase (trimethoprim resistance protein)
MNNHDIELPPLPDWFAGYSSADKHVVQAYAYAAIEADRKRRGEPVGYFQNVNSLFPDAEPIYEQVAGEHVGDSDVFPLYAKPQPTEPVKEVSDAPAALRFAAQVVELYDDATMDNDYMIDSGDCAGILSALADYFSRFNTTPPADGRAQQDADKADIQVALAAAQANVTHLSALADRWIALRNVPDDLLGHAGIPCISIPEGPKRGKHVNGEDAEQAVDQIIADRAQQSGEQGLEVHALVRRDAAPQPAEPVKVPSAKFTLGDHVRKTKGSRWQGIVVGTYSTSLTPEGYAVESDTETGSVQIYPAAALERVL